MSLPREKTQSEKGRPEDLWSSKWYARRKGHLIIVDALGMLPGAPLRSVSVRTPEEGLT